jgi:hypothetical protein
MSEKVAPDEPIFVLRAQDKLAPAMVSLWCELAALSGCGQAKVDDARRLAESMREWQRKTGALMQLTRPTRCCPLVMLKFAPTTGTSVTLRFPRQTMIEVR